MDVDSYLLKSKTAKNIYKTTKDLPLIDLYSKIPLADIINNKKYTDIWDLLASSEHHIWQLMRRVGISEDYITGNRTNREKWEKLSSIFPQFIGNPTYQLVYLSLRRILDINDSIDEGNSGIIWEKSIEKLSRLDFQTNEILKNSKVCILSPLCDPTDDLSLLINIDRPFKILPILNVDKLLDINSPKFIDYINKLDHKYLTNSTHFSGFKNTVETMLEYFIKNGCKTAIIDIFKPSFKYVDDLKAAYIYSKVTRQEPITSIDIKEFQSYMTYFLFELFKNKNITAQLHIGTFKNYRTSLKTIDLNIGANVVSNFIDVAAGLKELLNQFDSQLDLVIYISDVTLLSTVLTIARAFPRIYLGSPISLNYSFTSIYNYLNTIASLDLLINFAGYASDSTNVLSLISKNEIFRRTVSQLIADYIDRGEINKADGIALASAICYNNAIRFIK